MAVRNKHALNYHAQIDFSTTNSNNSYFVPDKHDPYMKIPNKGD